MSDLRTLNTTDWGHGTDLATRNRVLRNTYWLLALSLLKKALRYHCGHTITQIMVQMGLTTEKGRVTEKGQIFCYEELGARKGG